jgi:hypothetical protein
MAAVLGLRSAAVGALADRVTTPDEPVWIANINAADQIALSGSIAALERAKAASRLAGARRWEPLDVTIASHCPLQKPTAERMAAHLAGLPRRPQRVAYLTNTGGRRVRADSAAVLDDLAQAVARPVQWYDAMRLMPELGATCAIQMPSRCHPGMPWRHCWPARHPPCTPLPWRTTGSNAPSLRARRFRCTDACPGAIEVTNQTAAERLASKTTGTLLLSSNARLINMVRSGVLDISQASITPSGSMTPTRRLPAGRTERVIRPHGDHTEQEMNPANAFRRHPALRMVSAAGAGLG